MKKLMSASLACMMAASMCMPVLAAEAAPAITVPKVGDQEAHKGENNVPVTLDILRQNKPIVTFSVTVPTSLPLVMDLSGNVKTATNAQIKNNSTEDVVVTDVKLAAAEGWTLADYNANLKKRPADTKELGMEINTCKTTTDGLQFNSESFPTVLAKADLPITYKALLPRQKTAGSVGTVANSVFVIGWADPTVEDPLDAAAKGTVISNTKMASAAQALTGTVKFSSHKYTGSLSDTATDISEAGDGSVVCVVDGQNATIYGDGGVKANGNVFEGYQAETIDVNGLDTTEAVSMNGLFNNAAATTILNLNSLKTDQVTDFTNAFAGTHVTQLDLSSFNTGTGSATVTNMFNGTTATKVYCRTEQDMDNMKTSGEVSAIEFVVGMGKI